MRFRGDVVFVNADDAGKLVLDGDGRAEMKYRETDAKSYRPSPRNLEPAGPGDTAGDPSPPNADKPRPRTEQRPRAAAGAARKAGGASTATGAKADSGAAPPGDVAVAVWTDGACTGNPGPMGIGMVVIAGERRLDRGEYLGQGTNNIAELTAIGRGLQLAQELGVDVSAATAIYTDSTYAIGVLHLGWKAKANQSLIAALKQQLKPWKDLRFVKVRGHAGVPLNERCDELARAAIRERGAV